jgi:cobalt-precorrin-7 (C5)-methyltransferase
MGRNLLMLTNETQVPRQTAEYLVEHGIPATTTTLICEYLTMEDEQVYEVTLGDVVNNDYRLTSVMVVKNPAPHECCV